MLCEQAKIGEDGVLAEYLQKIYSLFNNTVIEVDWDHKNYKLKSKKGDYF